MHSDMFRPAQGTYSSSRLQTRSDLFSSQPSFRRLPVQRRPRHWLRGHCGGPWNKHTTACVRTCTVVATARHVMQPTSINIPVVHKPHSLGCEQVIGVACLLSTTPRCQPSEEENRFFFFQNLEGHQLLFPPGNLTSGLLPAFNTWRRNGIIRERTGKWRCANKKL